MTENIKSIQNKYGKNAVGSYRGNPNVHNTGLMLFGAPFMQSIGSNQKYTATSVDQLPHHFASLMMFGHYFMFPIPDIDRTDFMLIMGGNLRPDSTAVKPWAVNFVKTSYDYVADMDKKKDTTTNWALVKQHLGLLKDEPNFSIEDLNKIQIPVLVVAADRDIITLEHTVEMFKGFPNANLAIIPGETHFAPNN